MEKVHKISLPLPYGEKEVHAYFIEDEKKTLVDTGIKSRESWETFQKKLHEIGYRPTDIGRVILTHHHPDHCGMLDFFPESIEVAAHPRNEMWISQNKQFIDNYRDFFEQMGKEMGLPLNVIRDNQDIMALFHHSCRRSLSTSVKEGDLLAGFQVIETPGHASTHISLFRQEDGLFIGGDILLSHVTPNPIIEPPMGIEVERQKSLLLYIATLHKLAEKPIKRVLPGHGEVFENVHEVINFQLEKQKRRSDRVMEILQGKVMTVFDISKELYPLLYEKQYSLTLSQTIGQLDYLEYNDLIEIDKTGEAWLYSLK